MRRIQQREPEITEPALVTDIFVSGMMPVEDLGDFIRVTFFADRRMGGHVERIVTARIVWSREAFLAAHSKVREFVGPDPGKVVALR